jgi:O-antigen ligase
MILLGLFILKRRGMKWSTVCSFNRSVFLFYAFCAISVVWSDYSFISFKRWIKIFGHVVMVLLILTEGRPLIAARATLYRCSAVLLPLSVLLIKYYPELGRGVSRFTYEPICLGAALGKNELGITLVVCGLTVFWELLDVKERGPRMTARLAFANCLLLWIMTCWLLAKANSATSLACTVLGAGGLMLIRLPLLKRRRKNLVGLSIVAALVLGGLSSLMDFSSGGLQMLGRDSSLTGRTEIWANALKEQPNALLGAGFYSFWIGARADRLSENYFFKLNQAHNGYLETYLDLGAVGLFLLIIMLASAGKRAESRLVDDVKWGSFAFSIWVICILHNWTEASFARLNLLWFVLLLVAMDYRESSSIEDLAESSASEGNIHPNAQDRDREPAQLASI